MSSTVTVTNKSDRQRYEAVVDDTTLAGYVEYQETTELVVLTHTESTRSTKAEASVAAPPAGLSTTSVSVS